MSNLAIELKEVDADSISGTPLDFGSPLENPATKIQVINDSAVRVYIRKEGEANFLKVPANGCITLDESTMPTPRSGEEYYLSKGTQLQVVQVTGAGAAGTQIWAHIVTRIR